jgi:hypothetical protein
MKAVTKDYTRIEQHYTKEFKKATHDTVFTNRNGEVRLEKRARPKTKNRNSNSGGSKKSYHQPPANQQEIQAGRELVTLIKQLIGVQPEEKLANRRRRLEKWCLANNAEDKWSNFKELVKESHAVFDAMEVLFPTTHALPPDQISDFIETSNLPNSGKHSERRDLRVNLPKIRMGGVNGTMGEQNNEIIEGDDGGGDDGGGDDGGGDDGGGDNGGGDDDNDDDDEFYSENNLPALNTIVEVSYDDQWWIAKVIRHADTRIWVQYDYDGSKSYIYMEDIRTDVRHIQQDDDGVGGDGGGGSGGNDDDDDVDSDNGTMGEVNGIMGGVNGTMGGVNGAGVVAGNNVITEFPQGTVPEMPGVSRRHPLIYSGAQTFPVSTIDHECIHYPLSVEEDRGVVVMSTNTFGVKEIHGFRWPRRYWLTPKEQKQHFNLCQLQQKCRSYLKRGADCASLSVSFSAIGYKCDRDTGNLSLYTDIQGSTAKVRAAHHHSNKARAAHHHSNSTSMTSKGATIGTKERAHYVNAVAGVRNFAEKILYPRLQKIFFLETAVIELFWFIHGVRTFAAIWSSITTGGFFMPRGHVDADLLPSNLVCSDRRPKKNIDPNFDTGILGGDWAFPGTGWVLKSMSGTVFTYMPWKQHCTTRFAIAKKRSDNPFRYYSAFYGKEAVVRASGTVIEVAKRKANRKKVAAKKRKKEP